MKTRFYNRTKELEAVNRIVSGIPNALYFVYGPINSGKTTLFTQAIKNMPEEIVCFYINFRGRNIDTSGDFLNLLFSIDRKSHFDSAKEYLREIGKTGSDLLKIAPGSRFPKRFSICFLPQKIRAKTRLRIWNSFSVFCMTRRKCGRFCCSTKSR